MTVLAQRGDSALDLKPEYCSKVSQPKAPSDLQRGLARHPKHLPCRFLYDQEGSILYTRITDLEEYYPYRTELQLLKAGAHDIIRHIPKGSVVVELGVGDASKTGFLLDALLERDGPQGVVFCGIDCSAEALSQARSNLAHRCPNLERANLSFIEAEYGPGVAAARAAHPDAMLCLLWLGSSVGNFSRDEAADFLRQLAVVGGERSQLLLATDLWKDKGVLHLAYDDPAGVTRAFIKNGMRHALSTLGVAEALAGPANWEYEALVNSELKQVEMWLTAKSAVPEACIARGERVLMEISRKFTREGIADLAQRAGLCRQAAWGDSVYCISLLLPPRQTLLRTWGDSDSLFDIIRDWTAQPIGLRHPFLFYYGHSAAFLKLKLLPQEEPSALDIMLSRGIDPLVHDPSKCHSHPDIPTAWPSREELVAYVAQTRQKVLRSLEGLSLDPGAMHALCMGLEHERMHQETLCYMVAQQRKKDFLSGACSTAAVIQFPAATCADDEAGKGRCTEEAGKERGAGGASKGGGAEEAWKESSGKGGGQGPSFLLHSSLSPVGEVLPFYLHQCSYTAAALLPRPPAATCGQAKGGIPARVNGRENGRCGGGYGQGEGHSSGQGYSSGQGNGVRAPITPGSSPGNPPRLQPMERPGLLKGLELVEVPGTKVRLGLGSDVGAAYAWDNELGEKLVEVSPFRLASTPITVGQFREFMITYKGYERPELWTPSDYDLMRGSSPSGSFMPATWSLDPASKSPGDFLIHMPEATYTWQEVADCPAYVSLAEAQAFCRLFGGRVMTEAEHAAASQHAATWQQAGGGAGRHIVRLHEGGWEWTCSELEPLPGFKADPLYPEYSTDFFDGCHFVLKGSCPYTHPTLRRPSFRNFYQRNYPYMFAKFRLARDAEE